MNDNLVSGLVLANGLAVNKAGTSYSDSAKFYKCTGYASMLAIVTEDAAGASMTITQQCSADNITWYSAVDKNNTAIGAVAATFTVGSRYIQFDPVLCPYIRFKIVEGNVNAGTVSITLFMQE